MEEREVMLYCDLHGHSRHQNIFIYGCEYRAADPPQRRMLERVFPYMLSRNAPDMFSYKHCRFHVQKSKEGTGRVVVWNMGIHNSYTLEVSTCCDRYYDDDDNRLCAWRHNMPPPRPLRPTSSP